MRYYADDVSRPVPSITATCRRHARIISLIKVIYADVRRFRDLGSHYWLPGLSHGTRRAFTFSAKPGFNAIKRSASIYMRLALLPDDISGQNTPRGPPSRPKCLLCPHIVYEDDDMRYRLCDIYGDDGARIHAAKRRKLAYRHARSRR